MPTRSRHRATWLVTLGLLTGGLLHAATPVFWRVATQAELLRGEVENLTLDDSGRLRLGPVSEVVYDATMPVLWSAARAGDTLWVGSGNDGRVFTVRSDGVGAEVFDADELDIHAVAPLGSDRAYVASSPHGKVYEVSTGSEPRVVFDPEEQYIWALALTPTGDALYVATGEPGRVYRVTPDGESTLYYETRTTHVLSLALDANGALLAGTGSPGRVFRISDAGRGFVVLDSQLGEIRALRPGEEGRVYAVGVSESPGGRPSPPSPPTPTGSAGAPTTSSSTSGAVTAVVTVTTTPSPPPAPPTQGAESSGSGAVYRIEADGVWDTVWESSTDTPYDVLPDALGREGGLLVATGPSGKIFRVLADPTREILLARVAAQQVTEFVRAPDGAVYYVTANPGKVHRLSATPATSGSYVSEVQDATTVATWGTVRWRATTPEGTRVRLRTRTGNTDEPNDMWSPWSEPYDDARGSAITSPKARYIQWKAELSGAAASPTLLAVTTAYLPRNLRPEITTLTVHEPGVAFQQPFPGNDPPIAGLGAAAEARNAASESAADSQPSTLGRRVFRKGLRTFVWTARDGNRDDLEFDVLYRGDAESEWRPLVTDSLDSVFTWDTTTTPDGTYLVRVVATDGPSNAPGAALSGFVDSTPFGIDNTAPEIVVDAGRRSNADTVVPFVVRDASSPVQRVEYSLDTERWQVVYPLDGIPDSQQERFEVTVPTEALERLVIRATDVLGNTVTAAGS